MIAKGFYSRKNRAEPFLTISSLFRTVLQIDTVTAREEERGCYLLPILTNVAGDTAQD